MVYIFYLGYCEYDTPSNDNKPTLIHINFQLQHINNTMIEVPIFVGEYEDAATTVSQACLLCGFHDTRFLRCQIHMLIILLHELRARSLTMRSAQFSFTLPREDGFHDDDSSSTDSNFIRNEKNNQNSMIFVVKPEHDFQQRMKLLFTHSQFTLKLQHQMLLEAWFLMYSKYVRSVYFLNCSLPEDVILFTNMSIDSESISDVNSDFLVLSSSKDNTTLTIPKHVSEILHQIQLKSLDPPSAADITVTHYIENAQRLLTYAAAGLVDIAVYVPVGYGFGNVIKGFLTFLSISPAKVLNNVDLVLGDYASILHEQHIYQGGKTIQLSGNLAPIPVAVEDVFTYRLLVLREEEQYILQHPEHYSLIRKESDAFSDNFPNNPKFIPLFSPLVAIDNVFDNRSIPRPILRRIIGTIDKLHFQRHLIEMVESTAKFITHPSLGVSVRSWAGVHEVSFVKSDFEEMQNSKFNVLSYKSLILKTIQQYNLQSIVITFDHYSLFDAFEEYLMELTGIYNIRVIHYVHNEEFNKLNLLQQAVVQMLTLAKTTVLIGDDRSTFLEAIFWFGKCKQLVLHPY